MTRIRDRLGVVYEDKTNEGACTVTSAQDEPRDVAEEDAVDDAPKKAKAPATGRRLSGAELEGRFEDWRSERREKREERTPEDDARRVRRGLSIAMGAGILALVVASGVTGQSFEASQARGAERITELTAQAEEAEAAPVDEDLSEQMAELSQAAAADAGKVSQAQQGFAELHHRASTEPDPGNGAPNEATLQIAEHRRVLAPLFDEGSYMAGEEDAYSWTSSTPFDPSQEIDPRFAWYVGYDEAKASSPDAYAWSVETVMPDLDAKDPSGLTSTGQVIWLCKDTETGQVLAWANASYVYDGEKGVFDDLEVVVTAAGDEHKQSGGPEPSRPEVPEISAPGTGAADDESGEGR